MFKKQNIFDAGEDYFLIYKRILTQERTKKEIKFLQNIIKNLFKIKKIHILDLACGFGRHAIPLAKLGFEVLGVDNNEYFLNLAIKHKKRLKLNNLNFIKNDMREINFCDRFDLAINMFTSFGYFRDEKENIKVIKNIWRALKSKGYFVLDLENPHIWLTSILTKSYINKKGTLVLKDNKINIKDEPRNSIITKITYEPWNQILCLERIFLKKDNNKIRRKEYKGEFRLYTLPQIKTYLELCGFKIKNIYGDYNCNNYHPMKSYRMIFIARK
ncbi:MAG: methyltransferase type 11 [Candidatus Parcubacteria bacterium]|nr:MAG: methyltransferase type 11 [Candidatus Parcubacteria bacterium]